MGSEMCIRDRLVGGALLRTRRFRQKCEILETFDFRDDVGMMPKSLEGYASGCLGSYVRNLGMGNSAVDQGRLLGKHNIYNKGLFEAVRIY